MITNSGSQRFDLYAGPFTKNDQLTASPFADQFLFIPSVPLGIAKQVLPSLNGEGASERRQLLEEREKRAYGLGYVDRRYMEWLEDMDRRNEIDRRAAEANFTLGYVTTDVGSAFVHEACRHPLTEPNYLSAGMPGCWRRRCPYTPPL